MQRKAINKLEHKTKSKRSKHKYNASTGNKSKIPSHLCWKQVVESVAVVLEGNPGSWCDLGYIYVLVQVYHILSLWIDFYEDFVLSHELDNLSNIGARLL